MSSRARARDRATERQSERQNEQATERASERISGLTGITGSRFFSRDFTAASVGIVARKEEGREGGMEGWRDGGKRVLVADSQR